ncbi:uncharacterized protein G2W53_010071 [Senna tora]|uniref:Uncharacterized protein n=1 Tax=Senna tora TaxID=362788 RepID=A0A834X092_9FABA|nr:uncharacterized protein G2W53_010071 [Senna tora]
MGLGAIWDHLGGTTRASSL